ncbi:hypothetical protein IG631_18936 [Alternaria alternata]|nr:hypothetical protein IG631_18936 [Alternaria alternata]
MIAILASLHPTQSQESLLETLVRCNGSIEQAKEILAEEARANAPRVFVDLTLSSPVIKPENIDDSRKARRSACLEVSDALDERELACVHYRHCGHSMSYQHGIIGELYNGRSGTAVQGQMWKMDRSPRRPRLVLLARRVLILTPNPHPENSVFSRGTPSFEQLECRHSCYLCKTSGRSTRFLQR